MQIDNPIWFLRQICPCCEQGFPAFVVCPNCNFVTVQCVETGDTFSDAKELELVFVKLCPNCSKIETKNFVKATLDDIRNAGFTTENYE